MVAFLIDYYPLPVKLFTNYFGLPLFFIPAISFIVILKSEGVWLPKGRDYTGGVNNSGYLD